MLATGSGLEASSVVVGRAHLRKSSASIPLGVDRLAAETHMKGSNPFMWKMMVVPGLRITHDQIQISAVGALMCSCRIGNAARRSHSCL